MEPVEWKNLEENREYSIFMLGSTDNPNPHDAIFSSIESRIIYTTVDGEWYNPNIGNFGRMFRFGFAWFRWDLGLLQESFMYLVLTGIFYVMYNR